MKSFEKLTEHPFVKKYFEYNKPFLDKVSAEWVQQVKDAGKIRNKGNVILENSEYYHVMVFKKVSALIFAIDRLENCLIYMQNFPRPRTYEKKGINQYSWLEYHFSYFVVTFHSLFDIALILTNVVFQLGIPEKDCKSSTIKENDWVNNTPVKKALTLLENSMSNYGHMRNLFVHRGELPDVKSITESEFLDRLELISFAQLYSESLVPQEILDLGFNYESDLIVKKLKNDVKMLKKAVSQLFETLLPIYTHKTKTISLQTNST